MDKARSEPVSRIGQADHLVGCERAARDLDALHLDAILPLRVRAELEADLLHLDLPDLAAAEFLDVLGVFGELSGDMRRQAGDGERGGDGGVDGGHGWVLRRR